MGVMGVPSKEPMASIEPLTPAAATASVVRAFRIATFPVWCCIILIVLAPWRPFVRLAERSALKLFKDGRLGKHARSFARGGIILVLLAIILLLLVIVSELWSGFREEVPDLRRLKESVRTSKLCTHTRTDSEVGFFVENPRLVVSIGGFAVLRVVMLFVHSVLDPAERTSKLGRAAAAMPVLLLWETIQRSMAHSLVVALVDALDQLVCYSNALACRALHLRRVERSPWARRTLAQVPPLLWMLRTLLLRPSTLFVQLVSANVAFGTTCADENIGGAAFSILVALSTLVVHVAKLVASASMATMRGLVCLHVDAARRGWENGVGQRPIDPVKED